MLQGSLPGKDRGSQGSPRAPSAAPRWSTSSRSCSVYIRETSESPERGWRFKKNFPGNLRPESGWKGAEGSAEGGRFRDWKRGSLALRPLGDSQILIIIDTKIPAWSWEGHGVVPV